MTEPSLVSNLSVVDRWVWQCTDMYISGIPITVTSVCLMKDTSTAGVWSLAVARCLLTGTVVVCSFVRQLVRESMIEISFYLVNLYSRQFGLSALL
jgi:hypothetical protein